MFKKDDIVDIKIESLAFGGEGVGKVDGFPVFIPDSALNDELKVRITFAKKSFAKGEIIEIIKPSPDRIKPFCALANVCGGCQWQHIDYDAQLKAKKQIVIDSLSRIGKLDLDVKDPIASPQIKEYRCKVQYPVQQTKVSKRFLAGYYKKNTHEVVNIKYCPIQPEVLNGISEFIKLKAQEMGLTAYNERRHKGLLRHIVFRYSSTNNQILTVFILNSNDLPSKIVKLAELVKQEFESVIGVLVNFNTRKTNVIFGNETKLICGKDFIEEDLEDAKFKISAGSFFQVNPKSAANLFNTVKTMIQERIEKPRVLDVYAGVGSIAVWLKDIAAEVNAIEVHSSAVEDAKENIKLNNADNINIIEGDAQKVLNDLCEENKSYDVVVLDPPRKGCDIEALESVSKLAEKFIVYVSCNPSTLARDLKILNEKGFTPEYVQPVDMFCHTYHIESVVVLRKTV